jgi:hypothetical protein
MGNDECACCNGCSVLGDDSRLAHSATSSSGSIRDGLGIEKQTCGARCLPIELTYARNAFWIAMDLLGSRQ